MAIHEKRQSPGDRAAGRLGRGRRSPLRGCPGPSPGAGELRADERGAGPQRRELARATSRVSGTIPQLVQG